jgi:stage II sporulation protein AA (anti-sigma F factor antagonist)
VATSTGTWFDLEMIGGVQVVRLLGPKISTEACEQLHRLEDRAESGRFVLDFGRVRFMSSHAIAVVVGLGRRIEADGGRMAVCGLDDDLRELLRFTGVDRLVAIYPGEAEALASFDTAAGRVDADAQA